MKMTACGGVVSRSSRYSSGSFDGSVSSSPIIDSRTSARSSPSTHSSLSVNLSRGEISSNRADDSPSDSIGSSEESPLTDAATARPDAADYTAQVLELTIKKLRLTEASEGTATRARHRFGFGRSDDGASEKLKIKRSEIKVVLADDCAVNRLALQALFECLKIPNVHAVEDGEQLIGKFREVHPHFVLSDIEMPKMRGDTACAVIRRSEPYACLVSQSSHEPSTYDSGVFDLTLQKPLTIEKVKNALDQFFIFEDRWTFGIQRP